MFTHLHISPSFLPLVNNMPACPFRSDMSNMWIAGHTRPSPAQPHTGLMGTAQVETRAQVQSCTDASVGKSCYAF